MNNIVNIFKKAIRQFVDRIKGLISENVELEEILMKTN